MNEDMPECIIDEKLHGARQVALVVDIVLAIEKALVEAKLPSKQVNQLRDTIGFSVCAILDAAHEMIVVDDDDDDNEDCEELPLIPCVSFFLDEARTKLLISPNGTSFHEHVHGATIDYTDE